MQGHFPTPTGGLEWWSRDRIDIAGVTIVLPPMLPRAPPPRSGRVYLSGSIFEYGTPALAQSVRGTSRMITVTASGGAPDVRTTASVTSLIISSFVSVSLPVNMEISTSGIPSSLRACAPPDVDSVRGDLLLVYPRALRMVSRASAILPFVCSVTPTSGARSSSLSISPSSAMAYLIGPGLVSRKSAFDTGRSAR